MRNAATKVQLSSAAVQLMTEKCSTCDELRIQYHECHELGRLIPRGAQITAGYSTTSLTLVPFNDRFANGGHMGWPEVGSFFKLDHECRLSMKDRFATGHM